MLDQFPGATTHFAIGEVCVDVIIDDDDFELPLGQFLPGSDTRTLVLHRGVLEPEFLDLDRDIVKFAVQSFLVRMDGRTLLVDTCVGVVGVNERRREGLPQGDASPSPGRG